MSVVVNPDLVEQSAALSKAAAIEPAAPDAPTATLPQLADQPRTIDLLASLKAIPQVTADDLRTTKCGLLVAKLSKFHHPSVSQPAKELLAKWKALVGVTTPVEVAKANQAAKAKELAAAKQPPAVKSEPKVHDSEESSDEETSSKKRKSEKHAEKKKSSTNEESQAKKQKTSQSSPPPTGAIKKDAPLAHQYPELMKGPYGLFYTEDSIRDKTQYLIWRALGDPPKEVSDRMAQLESFTSKAKASPKVDPSPSPPPIGDIHLSTPVASDAAAAVDVPASAAPAAAPASAKPATSSPGTATGGPTFHSRQELAFLIEAAMWAKYGKEMSRYTQKYRDLAPQLGTRNEELTTSLYLGRLSAADLVTASLISLAPSTLREKREKEAAWNREAARSDIGMDTGATDQFLCDRCHSEGKEGRNCTYFQMQTRGADEPMTIFVTCLDCGNKFRSGDGER